MLCSRRLSLPKIAGIFALAAGAVVLYRSTRGNALDDSSDLVDVENEKILQSRSLVRQSYDVSKHEVPSIVNSRIEMPPARVVLGERTSETAFLTIGITTGARGIRAYLQQTLDSLFHRASPEELSQIVIVVFVGDFNATSRQATRLMLSTRYKTAIGSGRLIAIDVDRSEYPPLQDTVNGYNDSAQRILQRTKQVVDCSVLWRFSAHLSPYYLHLEDNVAAAAGYVSSIRAFIEDQTKPWVCLHFSRLAFLGKLFRSRDLIALAHLAEQFYTLHPVDYILGYFLSLSSQPMEGFLRIPILFQQLGEQSSIEGQIQSAIDKALFNLTRLYGDADNPPAKFATNMTIWEDFQPQLAYGRNPGIFWAEEAKKNHYVSLTFVKPQEVKRVRVETGLKSRKGDFLEHGVLEASIYLTSGNSDCSSYVQIGHFVNGTADTGDIDKGFIKCLRVRVTESQGSWLVISEIAVFVR